MRAKQVLETARDAVSVRRVFGEPVERDGVVVIPVAMVAGGGGGGGGGDQSGSTGSGGGFGVWARPVGVYVISDGTATFKPAIDVVALVGIAVALVGRVTVAALRRREPRKKVKFHRQ